MEIIKQFIAQKLNNENIYKQDNENGFSLLELVVAVGILLILTVSGLVSYNQIVNNARNARVNNLATDLFMMGATYRSAGENKEINSENLEQWATANNMTFEKIETEGCQVYKNSVKGEALEIEFSVDNNGRISVLVKNTSNGYAVDRKEPGFNDNCSSV